MSNSNFWYLGTIGFSYRDWVGPFFPVGTSQREYLPYYSKAFNAVELNTTFHAVPQQKTVYSWGNSTPPGFHFCLKTPHRITHELELHGTQGLMNEFLESIKILAGKLGPILIQLPPRFTQTKLPVLSEFLDALPANYRYAIEFRHRSWYNEYTKQLLRDKNIGWVASDFPNLPKEIHITASFLYIRWIGINGTYQHHTHERVDKSNELQKWLDTILRIAEKVDHIYGFFNNDYAGFAAGTCIRFKYIAGIESTEGDLPYQDSFL